MGIKSRKLKGLKKRWSDEPCRRVGKPPIRGSCARSRKNYIRDTKQNGVAASWTAKAEKRSTMDGAATLFSRGAGGRNEKREEKKQIESTGCYFPSSPRKRGALGFYQRASQATVGDADEGAEWGEGRTVQNRGRDPR